MCTCIKWTYKNTTFFGRTLDSPINYNMDIVITPRNYSFTFRFETNVKNNYAMIGMADVYNDYPLYAEAVNEKGLAMAGLEFPNNAYYFSIDKDKKNICPFEFIPYILRQADTVEVAKKLLDNIQLVNIPFNESIELSNLHWIISDTKESIVVESTVDGLKIYDNPFHTLTNNPCFYYHKENINNYLNLTSSYPKNQFSNSLELSSFSNGLGAIHLPGDYSSTSRFIKATFLIFNSKDIENINEAIHHFFHILDSVSPTKGSSLTKEGLSNFTIYTSCIDIKNAIYYYKSYWNNQIKAVQLKNLNLDGMNLIVYKSNLYKENIMFLN